MAGTSPAMTLHRYYQSPRTAGAVLRRLLRRHLVDLTGLQVDADAVDVVEIDAGHAHEARLVRIIDRMDLAVLIDAGMAGLEPVFLFRRQLGVLGIGAVVLALPFGHVGP